VGFWNWLISWKNHDNFLTTFNSLNRRIYHFFVIEYLKGFSGVATNQLASEYIPMEMRIESQGPDETVQSLPKENNIS